MEYSFNSNENSFYEVSSGHNSISFFHNDNQINIYEYDNYGLYYYPLNGVNAKSSAFPEVQKGTDVILLRIDQYSITQYIGNSYGK